MFSQDSWEEAISDRGFNSEYEVVRSPGSGVHGQTTKAATRGPESVVHGQTAKAAMRGEEDYEEEVRGPKSIVRGHSAVRVGRDKVDGGRRVKTDENYEAALLGTSVGAEELTDPLQAFADAGYITDVVNRVKSGKEATVFC